MSASRPPVSAHPAAIDPVVLDRHRAGLRHYVASLPGAVPAQVDALVADVIAAAATQPDAEEDPAVWLFATARRRVLGTGMRADVGGEEGATDDPVEGEDPRVAVHRTFARLTAKQQEALRLKFQFGFGLDELAQVTGLSRANGSALWHHAMQRVCQALNAQDAADAQDFRDPRITAFAFDELDDGEKKAFVAAAGDGKQLLEQTERLRRAGQILSQVLASGAPVPKRRKRRQRGAGQKATLAAVLVLLLLGAGVAWWWQSRRSDEASPPRAARRTDASGDASESAPSVSPAASTESRPRNAAERAKSPVASRSLRPGEADWEKKAFGRGLASGDRPAGGVLPSNPATAAGGSASVASGSDAGDTSGFGAMGSSPRPGREAANPPDRPNPDEAPQPGRDKPDDVAITLAGGAGGVAAGSVGTSALPSVAGGGRLSPAAPDVQEPRPDFGKGQAAQAQGKPSPRAVLPVALGEILKRGDWPKPEAVSFAAPADAGPAPKAKAADETEDAISIRTEGVRSPWQPDQMLVRVTATGRPVAPPARRPANLVLAIDVSDSMARPNRLALVEEGVQRLADRLLPDDRVAVVTYAATAKTVLPSVPLGERGIELRNAIAALETSGRTNGSDGLRLAYEVARGAFVENGINVVVLCTDGNFNLGDTDPAVLAARASEAAAAGITLSVFGFGRTDRNDIRLEMLATAGRGRSCYVNTRDEAERLLTGQIDRLFAPAATGLELGFAMDRGAARDWRRLDDSTAGTAATAAEVLPGRGSSWWFGYARPIGEAKAEGRLGEWTLEYRCPGAPARERHRGAVTTELADWARVDPGFKFGAAMTELARILRGDRADALPLLARLESWVQDAFPGDEGGYRAELLESVAAAREAAPLR